MEGRFVEMVARQLARGMEGASFDSSSSTDDDLRVPCVRGFLAWWCHRGRVWQPREGEVRITLGVFFYFYYFFSGLGRVWCLFFCFFPGGGDVRIGSVSGVSSGGGDLGQLERDSRRTSTSRTSHATRANLWPDQIPGKGRLHGRSTEARGIVTHPVSFSTRSISRPRRPSLSCFGKGSNRYLIVLYFFSPSLSPPPPHRPTAPFSPFARRLRASTGPAPDPFPAYNNYRSFLSDRGCMCCATQSARVQRLMRAYGQETSSIPER